MHCRNAAAPQVWAASGEGVLLWVACWGRLGLLVKPLPGTGGIWLVRGMCPVRGVGSACGAVNGLQALLQPGVALLQAQLRLPPPSRGARQLGHEHLHRAPISMSKLSIGPRHWIG